MTENIQPRQATVNRDSNGDVIGITLFLGAVDLAALGVNPEKFDSIEYVATERGLEVYGDELRNPRTLDGGIVLEARDVPVELSKSEVQDRYPDESPADYGAYWDRQRKVAFGHHGIECHFCEATDPSLLDVTHREPPETFDSLYAAHNVTNLLVLCDECRDGYDR